MISIINKKNNMFRAIRSPILKRKFLIKLLDCWYSAIDISAENKEMLYTASIKENSSVSRTFYVLRCENELLLVRTI